MFVVVLLMEEQLLRLSEQNKSTWIDLLHPTASHTHRPFYILKTFLHKCWQLKPPSTFFSKNSTRILNFCQILNHDKARLLFWNSRAKPLLLFLQCSGFTLTVWLSPSEHQMSETIQNLWGGHVGKTCWVTGYHGDSHLVWLHGQQEGKQQPSS